MRPLTRMALAILAGLLLLALILVLVIPGPAGRSGTASLSTGAGAQFDGAALPTTALAAPGFSLRDQGGQRVTLERQRGAVTVLTFLYSRCGAPCIVIAEQIRGALDQLRRRPHVLIVSADPSTDTSASVRAFLAEVSLTGRVSYLTGPPGQLRRIWRDYRVTPAAAGAAAFARAAFVLLIDPSGHERVLFGPEQLTPEGLAHDIGRLQGG